MVKNKHLVPVPVRVWPGVDALPNDIEEAYFCLVYNCKLFNLEYDRAKKKIFT